MHGRTLLVVFATSAILTGCQTWQADELPPTAASPAGGSISGAGSWSAEEAYGLGYRIGHFDGSEATRYDPGFPPEDADGDGLYDRWEVHYGLDPNNRRDVKSDPDDDLLTALDEFWLGTNPTNADSDGDGIPDGVEFSNQLDPTDPADAQLDLDKDGATNYQEYKAGTAISKSGTSDSGEVRISWSPPSTRINGEALRESEIQGYEVMYGQNPNELNSIQTVPIGETTATITGLKPGTWYFAVRTIADSSGPLSDPIIVTIE